MAGKDDKATGVQTGGQTAGTALLDAPTGQGTNGVQGGEGTSVGGAAEGTSGEQQAANEVAEAAKKVKRNPDELPDDEVVGINIRIPNALRKLIAADGLKASPQVSVPQLVASMLASAYSFELPKPARPARLKKYASKEERLAAQKREQQRARNVTKAVLKLVEEGKLEGINIDELVAQIEAEQQAKAKAETETAGAAAS